MEENKVLLESADIFYFIPFGNKDSVLLIGRGAERYTGYLKRYAASMEIVDTENGCGCNILPQPGLFDKVIILSEDRFDSPGRFLKECVEVLKPGGVIAFVSDLRRDRHLIAEYVRKGVFIEKASYAVFDSIKKPSAIIPFERRPIEYYFRNIRYQTMGRFKRVVVGLFLSLNARPLTVPSFMVLCEKA
jgi:SAM-dependent methyltransferase